MIPDPLGRIKVMDDLTRAIIPLIRQMTGRQYRAFEATLPEMTLEARQDVLRLLRDLGAEGDRKARQASMQPWRMGR